MRKIKLTQGKYALVDSKDFEKLNKVKWHASKNGNTFYVTRGSKRINGKQKTIFMHRVITNTPKGMNTDHIDGNGLNNQRKNLRICTHSQNGMNRRFQRNNTSGQRGVYWDKHRNKWKVQLKKNGKNIFLGYFDDLSIAKKEAKKFYKTNFKAFLKEI